MHTMFIHGVKEIDITNRIGDNFAVSVLNVTDEKGQQIEINLVNFRDKSLDERSDDVKPLIRSVNGKRINSEGVQRND